MFPKEIVDAYLYKDKSGEKEIVIDGRFKGHTYKSMKQEHLLS